MLQARISECGNQEEGSKLLCGVTSKRQCICPVHILALRAQQFTFSLMNFNKDNTKLSLFTRVNAYKPRGKWVR